MEDGKKSRFILPSSGVTCKLVIGKGFVYALLVTEEEAPISSSALLLLIVIALTVNSISSPLFTAIVELNSLVDMVKPPI